MGRENTVGYDKIKALFDAGTFAEMGAYVKRGDANSAYDGVVCGYGAISGKLAFAFVQNNDILKGALDDVGAEKIKALYVAAMKNGAPVIAVFDGAGAVVTDGASALCAYGKVIKCVSDASGIIPQIALIEGLCSGTGALIAEMYDLVFVVKGEAKVFVNAPFNIGAVDNTSELAAYTAENEAEAVAKVRDMIDLLPQNNAEGIVVNASSDNVDRAVSADTTDMKALIADTFDVSSFTEIYSEIGKDTLAGIATLGGVTVGLVATVGRISPDGAKKAAKLISLCDSFSMPLVNLIDCEGAANDAESEKSGLALALSKLAMAYSSADMPKVSVVTGKAYGAGYTVMGSRALGADMAFALEGALISTMDPKTAVAFMWNDKVTAEISRESVEAEWTEKYALAERAAEIGAIDDIIVSAELRQRLCSAVYMLMRKSNVAPCRKHSNMPL